MFSDIFMSVIYNELPLKDGGSKILIIGGDYKTSNMEPAVYENRKS